MSKDSEREQLVRLREQQLRTRDPHTYDRRVLRTVTRRRSQRVKKVTPAEMFRNIPHKWRGLVIGLLIGMLIWVLVPIVILQDWAEPFAIVALVFTTVAGFLIGQAFDVRDEMRDI